jgi:hypothetical protein
MMGLTTGSYEAYCLDQAVWYLGTTISQELDKVGQKKDRKTVANEAARQRRLTMILDGKDNAKGQFADPAAFFTQ